MGRRKSLLNTFKAPRSRTKFTAGPKSAGILEDDTTRQVIRLKEGSVEDTPTSPKHLANKAYVDSMAASGAVTASVNLTDETIVQGDGGAKGVKTSTATVAQIAANVTHAAGDGSDHADVASNTTHRGTDGTADHSQVTTNKTHVDGDGSDHADVGTNTTGIATNATAIGLNTTHRNDNSQAHTDYMLNTGDTVAGTYTFTGNLFSSGLKSGANQGAAGAAENEIYLDTDDNTLKLGVAPWLWNTEHAADAFTILLLHMEENVGNTAVADSSGNGYSGVASTNTSNLNIAARFNDGFDMDDQYYVDINNNAMDTAIGAAIDTNVTFEVSFKSNVADWSTSGLQNHFWFYIDGNNKMYLRYNTTGNTIQTIIVSGGTVDSIYDASIVDTTTQHHIAFTYAVAADEMKLFIDGSQVGATQSGLGNWSGGNAIFRISCDPLAATDFADMVFDEFAISNVIRY